MINVNAQKNYEDPNVKTKKPLLEPGEKVPAVEVATEKKTVTTVTEEPSKLTKEQLRYCSCINYTRALEQKISLAESLHNDRAMTWNEFAKVENEADLNGYRGLVKKLEAMSDVEPDEFECNTPTMRAKKPKDYDKYLKDFDKTCQFNEIKRKTI